MSRILSLLGAMEKIHASDLFLAEGKLPASRIHGVVQVMSGAERSPGDPPDPLTRDDMEALLVRVLTPSQRTKFDAAGDMDVGFSLSPEPGASSEARRFRLALRRQQGQLACVARAVPSGSLDLADLGLPPELRRFADQPRGLVLVTGATGSGKSTTLASLIHHINQTRPAHIVTLEDPIEFVHGDLRSRVTQREIGSDSESFREGLRHAVRQSPDVLLIGEMRDVDTMTVALSAALTGHLVLASLHTIDSTQTLQRILSYFPEHLRAQAAMDLSLSLVGIISQRLLPASGEGKARVAAVEVLTNTPAVARLLREQRIDELADLLRSSSGDGMVSFNDAFLSLYRAGRITYDVGLAYASNPDEFALQARGMSTGVLSLRRADSKSSGLDLRALLKEADDRGASDLHLTSGRCPLIRLSGRLQPLVEEVLSEGDMRMLLNSVMTTRQRAIFELEHEVDFALALDDGGSPGGPAGGRRFRVNAYFQKGRMAAAMRAIPTEIPGPKELGLPDILLALGERPQGLLMVVGPTGSGKSTTLACLVNRINETRACRIITVEDPVEYSHRSKVATVDQREVSADTRSFSAAMKYILRQDPDVILIGEMRDAETISAALTAAETGHLVLATLHSNDAGQAMDRIIDTFPGPQQGQARAQLSACLLGVVSQRLMQRKTGGGRVGVFEVLVGTPAIRALIRDNKLHQIPTIMETARRDGMITMDTALKEAVRDGRVAYDEALRYVLNPKILPSPV